jgi:hypothetical protein
VEEELECINTDTKTTPIYLLPPFSFFSLLSFRERFMEKRKRMRDGKVCVSAREKGKRVVNEQTSGEERSQFYVMMMMVNVERRMKEISSNTTSKFRKSISRSRLRLHRLSTGPYQISVPHE